jgi:hypothetical protein
MLGIAMFVLVVGGVMLAVALAHLLTALTGSPYVVPPVCP